MKKMLPPQSTLALLGSLSFPASNEGQPSTASGSPVRATVTIGLQQVELHARDVRELWRQVAFFEDLPTACGECGSIDLVPGYQPVREFEFYSLRCRACRAELPMGRRRDGGLFPKHSSGWQPARHHSHPNSPQP